MVDASINLSKANSFLFFLFIQEQYMGTVQEQSCVSSVLTPELFLHLPDCLSPEKLEPQALTIRKDLSSKFLMISWSRGTEFGWMVLQPVEI